VRYRHLRRTVIAVLAAVALVLLIALIAQKVLDSRLFRHAAVRWIENAAANRGFDLQVDEVEWDVLPPRTILRGVTLVGPGISAEIDRLEADLARIRVARRTLELGTVAASGVTVRLEDIPRTETRPGRSFVRVVVRHLDLSDVTFEGRNLPGNLEVDLDGLDFAWTREQETPSGFIRIERASVTVPGMNPFVMAVQARVKIDHGIRLPSWQIDGRGFDVQGSGEIAGGSVRMDLSAAVDLDELDRVLRTHDLLDGSVAVSARIDTGAEDIVEAEVRSPGLWAAGFPVEDVQARLTVRGDSISGVLDSARFNGGQLSGSYRLSHLTGPTRPHSVRATAGGVSLAGLLGNLHVPAAGLGAEMDVEVGQPRPGHRDRDISPRAGGTPRGGPRRHRVDP